MRGYVLIIAGCLLMGVVRAQPAPVGIPVHDPVMIRQDSVWYLYCTGQGITAWCSTNGGAWRRLPPVFDKPPAWTVEAVTGFKGHFWAPDISYYKGEYYLFYAVSAFGKNTSCIGLAVNKTLNPDCKDYHWQDQGKIVQSVPGRDRWNAIDPNLIVDGDGAPWLAFGSFWSGIKLVKLREDRRGLAEPEQWQTIAARPENPNIPDTAAGDGAIEAPFIFRKNDWYYLFVSFDYCCRGEKSTYKMMVGRSRSVQGPYLDRDGIPMVMGGGALVLRGDPEWYGVGHNAVISAEGGDWLIFHGYDAKDRGRPKLRIEQLQWIDDWPTVSTH
ncbi:MAG TPA: arabinan endo-1,5-alpha-L-arabinosidase [Puia sp.]